MGHESPLSRMLIRCTCLLSKLSGFTQKETVKGFFELHSRVAVSETEALVLHAHTARDAAFGAVALVGEVDGLARLYLRVAGITVAGK